MQNHSITRNAMYISHDIEAHSCGHCCRRKAVSITYSECAFVVSVIQHAERMCHITLSSMASLDLRIFSTLSHKQHNVQKKKKLLNTKCVF